MQNTELTPENIIGSVSQIGRVLCHVKGRDRYTSPLDDQQLQKEFAIATRLYFEYCQQALLDPDILAAIKRTEIGRFDSNRWYAPVTKYIVGAHEISSHVHLIEDPQPRLTFSIEEYLSYQPSDSQKSILVKKIVEEVPSMEGFYDWSFGQTDDSFKRLFGYRTMGHSDLLFPGVLREFVAGIDTTFCLLDSKLAQEVLYKTANSKFSGETNAGKIRSITIAFNEANQVLARAFNPNSVDQSQLTRLQSPRKKVKK